MLLYTDIYICIYKYKYRKSEKRLEDYTSVSRKLVFSVKMLTTMGGLGVDFNYIGKVLQLLT